MVVIVRPYCPPDPEGPKYEQYCRQKLMLHVPFRNQRELLGNHTTFTAAYAEFLQSGSIPPSLEDDIHRLQQSSQEPSEDDTEVSRGLNLHTRVLTCMQYSSHFRNRAMNSPASDLPGLWRSRCSSARAMQTCSQALSHKKTWTGRQERRGTQTWRRCPPSSLVTVNRPVSTPSPPPPTLSTFKGSSCRLTTSYGSMPRLTTQIR